MRCYCKTRLEKLAFPVDGYKYNVQILRSVDGVNFYYCGNGKYFKEYRAAVKYMNEINRKEAE